MKNTIKPPPQIPALDPPLAWTKVFLNFHGDADYNNTI